MLSDPRVVGVECHARAGIETFKGEVGEMHFLSCEGG